MLIAVDRFGQCLGELGLAHPGRAQKQEGSHRFAAFAQAGAGQPHGIGHQHEEIEAVEPEASAEQVDPRDEKIANLEAQLAEAQTRERDGILRVKAEMENLRRRTELDIEKAHNVNPGFQPSWSARAVISAALAGTQNG